MSTRITRAHSGGAAPPGHEDPHLQERRAYGRSRLEQASSSPHGAKAERSLIPVKAAALSTSSSSSVTVVRTAPPYTKQHITMSFMMLSIKPMAAAAPTDLEPKHYRSRRGTRPISAAAAAAGAAVSGAAVATVQGPWLSSVGQPFSVQPPSRVRLCCAMVGALRPAPAQYSCSCPRKCPTS